MKNIRTLTIKRKNIRILTKFAKGKKLYDV